MTVSDPRPVRSSRAPHQSYPSTWSQSPTAHLAVRGVLVTGASAVVGLWWVNTAAGSVAGLGGFVTAVGRVAGLLGAYLVLVQILLMARLPWFESAVGYTRLAAWHRGLGTSVVGLLGTHVLLVVEGYALTDHHSTLKEGWTIVRTFPDMGKAALGIGLLILVAATSGARLRKRLSYESWYWLHLSAYVAVALTFFHQTSTGADFTGTNGAHVAARYLWTLLYIAVAAAVLWWRIARPVRGWFHHRLIVEAVVPEAESVVSIYLRGRNTAALGRAGQFLSVRFVTPGHLGTAHPYSLSAPPGGDRLRLTVKAAGDHTQALRWLRPGVPVLADGPFGRFTADQATQRDILLIAGGSGIAPIRALAEEFSVGPTAGGSPRRGAEIRVLYRASSASDLALARELDELVRVGRADVRYLVGRRAELGFDPLGADALARLVPDITSRDIFVCGPAGMVSTVKQSLRLLGVLRGQQHIEAFEL